MTREEAIARLDANRGAFAYKETNEALNMAIEALQTEVVRCKDCRHRDLFSCPLADNNFQKDEDFCSWGESEDEE